MLYRVSAASSWLIAVVPAVVVAEGALCRAVSFGELLCVISV